ncbi:hypothetical protein V5799_005651 [Amblyomma americanum]|uniref:TIR domain-containing protein n=1 Tax=Amblyomma americanum TaxID=6943 RepID=A0AAQ4DYM7_AMBAM
MRTAAQLTLAGLVLIAALNRSQCEAAELGGHCPISLDWCACMVVRRGPRVLCNATADGDAVSDDLSRLAGFAMDSLILDGVNLTTLPRHYFVNLTVKALVVRNTPMQSTEEDSFEGLTHLTTLDMSHNRLGAIPRGLTAVPTLKILRLPDNYIADFKNLPPLENLTDLDLSKNLIEKLDGNVLKDFPKLKRVWLANNLIIFLSTSFFKGAKNVTFVDLHNNMLTNVYTAFQGLRHLTIRDYNETLCEQGQNLLTSGKKFIDLGEKDLCPSRKVFIILAYGVPSLVLMVTAMAAVTAYLKYKHEIRVWLYARGICRSLQCIKEDDVDEDKDFDVFLSFSSKDREWAYSELLPKVEANGFSVCTYDRNFKGGFLIQDIVQEVVCCSRRTLLVVTQNYVESEWCRWEFRVAQHRALEDNINRLIVVVVGDVRPEGVDEELQRYMQETNYVRWGEAHFWDKLLYSLPKRDARTRVIPNMHPLTPAAPPAI